MNKKDQLQRLIDKYKSDIDYYRSARYNETQLRTDFLINYSLFSVGT